MLTITKVAASGTKMAIGDAAIAAVLGYVVVFFGLIFLMYVIIIAGKIMIAQTKKQTAKAEATASAPAVPAVLEGKKAPGSAGELKIYDVSEKDAAMIMAIVADKTGKPLNELRFKSIREVK